MYTNDNFHSNSFPIPNHVAIIPDGGRRWAKKHHTSYEIAYKISIKKMITLLEELYKSGTQYITIYFSSTQNFSRSAYEVKSFCNAGWDGILKEMVPFAIHNNISINIVGNCNQNTEKYKDKIEKVKQLTPFQSAHKLFICFNYNSLDEIEKACRKKDNNEKISFVNYLDIPYPVDILIRTGGAQTLSGFLLPQIAFARLFFLDKLFNDISISDFKEILSTYNHYNLKYGE